MTSFLRETWQLWYWAMFCPSKLRQRISQETAERGNNFRHILVRHLAQFLLLVLLWSLPLLVGVGMSNQPLDWSIVGLAWLSAYVISSVYLPLGVHIPVFFGLIYLVQPEPLRWMVVESAVEPSLAYLTSLSPLHLRAIVLFSGLLITNIIAWWLRRKSKNERSIISIRIVGSILSVVCAGWVSHQAWLSISIVSWFTAGWDIGWDIILNKISVIVQAPHLSSPQRGEGLGGGARPHRGKRDARAPRDQGLPEHRERLQISGKDKESGCIDTFLTIGTLTGFTGLGALFVGWIYTPPEWATASFVGWIYTPPAGWTAAFVIGTAVDLLLIFALFGIVGLVGLVVGVVLSAILPAAGTLVWVWTFIASTIVFVIAILALPLLFQVVIVWVLGFCFSSSKKIAWPIFTMMILLPLTWGTSGWLSLLFVPAILVGYYRLLPDYPMLALTNYIQSQWRVHGTGSQSRLKQPDHYPICEHEVCFLPLPMPGYATLLQAYFQSHPDRVTVILQKRDSLPVWCQRAIDKALVSTVLQECRDYLEVLTTVKDLDEIATKGLTERSIDQQVFGDLREKVLRDKDNRMHLLPLIARSIATERQTTRYSEREKLLRESLDHLHTLPQGITMPEVMDVKKQWEPLILAELEQVHVLALFESLSQVETIQEIFAFAEPYRLALSNILPADHEASQSQSPFYLAIETFLPRLQSIAEDTRKGYAQVPATQAEQALNQVLLDLRSAQQQASRFEAETAKHWYPIFERWQTVVQSGIPHIQDRIVLEQLREVSTIADLVAIASMDYTVRSTLVPAYYQHGVDDNAALPVLLHKLLTIARDVTTALDDKTAAYSKRESLLQENLERLHNLTQGPTIPDVMVVKNQWVPLIRVELEKVRVLVLLESLSLIETIQEIFALAESDRLVLSTILPGAHIAIETFLPRLQSIAEDTRKGYAQVPATQAEQALNQVLLDLRSAQQQASRFEAETAKHWYPIFERWQTVVQSGIPHIQARIVVEQLREASSIADLVAIASPDHPVLPMLVPEYYRQRTDDYEPSMSATPVLPDAALPVLLPELLTVARDVTAALEAGTAALRERNLERCLLNLLGLERRLPQYQLDAQALDRWTPVIDQWQSTVQLAIEQQQSESTGEVLNPFQTGNPIQVQRHHLFKGRRKFADNIVRQILDHNRPTLVLHGPRRCGKSSFLLNLPRLIPSQVLPVYIDVQKAAATSSDADFCYGLARGMRRDLRGRGIQLPEIQSRHFLPDPYPAFQDWLDQSEESLQGKQILLCLDEFEKLGTAISEGRISLRVFDELRHLIQHNESIGFLFCGVQTPDHLGPNWSSYFISAQLIEMTYLDPDEAEQVLTDPDPTFELQYDPGVVEHILSITRCQPFLIQLIGEALVKQANEHQTKLVTRTLVDAAIEPALTAGTAYFDDLWHEYTGTTPAEVKAGQSLLMSLAREQPLPRLDEEPVHKALERLLRYHTLEQVDGVYRFEVPLIKRWVQERATL